MSDNQEQATSSESGLPDETRREGREDDREEQNGSGRRWGGSVLRSRRSAEDPCGLHSILLQVRDIAYQLLKNVFTKFTRKHISLFKKKPYRYYILRFHTGWWPRLKISVPRYFYLKIHKLKVKIKGKIYYKIFVQKPHWISLFM